jgi:tetratricopeptide (TPR) repeat protein
MSTFFRKLIPGILALFCLWISSSNAAERFAEDQRIMYYYRGGQIEDLIPLLTSVSQEKDYATSPNEKAAMIHFFATAFQKNRGKNIKALQRSAKDEAQGVLRVVLEKTKSYKPASMDDLEMELIYAEYKATGDRRTVERLIKVADGRQEGPRDPARNLLVKMAARHSEVITMIRQAAEPSKGIRNKVMEEMVQTINSTFIIPAQEHHTRGLNFMRGNNHQAALEEFRKALTYYPDYYTAHMNIANALDDQGKPREAIEAAKKAISIDPTNAWAIGNIGTYYYKLREFPEAIKWYTAAIECNPKDTVAHYGLGIIYMQQNHKEKMIVHLREYLKLAPNGSRAASVMQYLAAAGQPVADDPTNVVLMLRNKKFNALEKTFQAALADKKRDKEATSAIWKVYYALCQLKQPHSGYDTRIAELKAWLQQYPSSHFANACLGWAYISHAWYARGAGYANTVTDKGNQLFEQRLAAARGYLEKAYSLDTSDAIVPTRLIWVAIGLGLERSEMEKQFKRAVAADPSGLGPYSAKAEYLNPKWYGEERQMLGFARGAVRTAPENSAIPLVLVLAHLDLHMQANNDPSYFRNPKIWKETKEAFEKVLKGFPEWSEYRNRFAYVAYLAGDYNTGRQEMKKIGDNWHHAVWRDKKTFDEIKRELFSRP